MFEYFFSANFKDIDCVDMVVVTVIVFLMAITVLLGIISITLYIQYRFNSNKSLNKRRTCPFPHYCGRLNTGSDVKPQEISSLLINDVTPSDVTPPEKLSPLNNDVFICDEVKTSGKSSPALSNDVINCDEVRPPARSSAFLPNEASKSFKTSAAQEMSNKTTQKRKTSPVRKDVYKAVAFLSTTSITRDKDSKIPRFRSQVHGKNLPAASSSCTGINKVVKRNPSKHKTIYF